MASNADDAKLLALSRYVRDARRAIDALLQGDDRDADEISGYTELADRHDDLSRELARTPARGALGLLVKAAAIDPRDVTMRTEGAIAIAFSLVTSVIDILSDVARP